MKGCKGSAPVVPDRHCCHRYLDTSLSSASRRGWPHPDRCSLIRESHRRNASSCGWWTEHLRARRLTAGFLNCGTRARASASRTFEGAPGLRQTQVDVDCPVALPLSMLLSHAYQLPPPSHLHAKTECLSRRQRPTADSELTKCSLGADDVSYMCMKQKMYAQVWLHRRQYKTQWRPTYASSNTELQARPTARHAASAAALELYTPVPGDRYGHHAFVCCEHGARDGSGLQ